MVDGWLLEWLHLGLRWTHLVVGAAWIGASFYFNWLNNHVEAPAEPGDGEIKGELFAVHGGAFYKVQKYAGAPKRLPETLHWFKYEAYFTWVTGFLLLTVVYWAQAKAFLIDPNLVAMAPWQAIAVSASVLVGGWVGYDLLCKSPLAKTPAALSGVGLLALTGIAYGLTLVFPARAAIMHVGALLGTIMAANVFFVIIPGQRKMVDALIAGRPPDVAAGAAGSLRSLHNNYLTFPVLLVMVSNHFPVAWGGSQGWLVVLGLMAGGFFIRHWMNLRHHGKAPAWLLAVGAVIFAVAGFSTRPPAPPAPVEGEEPVRFSQVQRIIGARCVSCHSSEPSELGLIEAPKGVKFETPDEIKQRADSIMQQAVVSKVMPPANLTGITDEERELLGRWVQQLNAAK